MDAVVWTFTGLGDVSMSGQHEHKLTDAFTLNTPNELLLSCRDKYSLNGRDFQRLENASCFLLLREQATMLRTRDRHREVSRLQNALMAFQVIKPLPTVGFIFQAVEPMPATLNLESMEARPPMDPGLWAKRRTFDAPFLLQVPEMIARVQRVMDGTDGRKKNAIYLFQLALEHFHPYVAALLAVAGMEAVFDSSDRNDFKNKLCSCVGASTLAFPDWNSPYTPPPTFTAEELAIHLYILRSKIAHGANLLEAANDKSAPVNLLELVDLVHEIQNPTYAMVLCESSIYLLAEVLRKVL